METTTTTTEKRGTPMPDNSELTSVPFHADYFESVVFMGSEPNLVAWTRDGQRIPFDQQQQATNNDGVKKWRVQVTARTAAWGNRRAGDVKNLTLGVTSDTDPGQGLGFGAPVKLEDCWFGFIRQRNGHVSAWATAGRIVPVPAPAAVK
jgi:hypothetical protein